MLKKSIYILLVLMSVLPFVSKAQTVSSFNNFENANLIKFYPNPATTFIQFDISDISNLSGATFKIFNFIGKKVYETNQLNERMVISLNDFFRGVYIFQLADRNGRVLESSKFQVQK
jgi:hypothetical protein